MRFTIVNLGCKVNRVESDSLALAFEALGMKAAESEVENASHVADSHAGEADIVVVNTCTVTGEAEKKTRKAVRRALKNNPAACVVVTGCAAAIDAQTFTQMDERVTVAGKLELTEAAKTREGLCALVSGLDFDGVDSERSVVDDKYSVVRYENAVGDGEPAINLLRFGKGYPTRVGIKVQDGCNNACTFCIVHVARGKAWSRSRDEVIAEAVRYAQAGVHEIVLTGINLGSYEDESLDFVGLLEALLAATEGVRFRISSIEPRDVDNRLIDLMASSNGRIARHLHLPLQSGSPRVLREMARPYKAEQFTDLVERLYAAMPSLSLSTDIIVGFPGETEEDFEATLAMAERCRFSKIHVFPYSMREGTPAAERTDQVAPQVKAQRAKQLADLGDILRAHAYETRRGTVDEVLIEAASKGMTESYFEIDVPDTHIPGELVSIRLP